MSNRWMAPLLVLALSGGRALAGDATAADPADLARRAYEALTKAGLDPKTEIKVAAGPKAGSPPEVTISSRSLPWLRRAGIWDMAAVRAACAKFPPGASIPEQSSVPPPPPAPGPGKKGAPPPPADSASKGPPPPADPETPPGPPPAAGASDGYGQKATGGTREVSVATMEALRGAAKQDGVRIVMKAGEYDASGLQITGKNLTLDGNGATFWGGGGNRNAPLMLATGTNMILRNFRVRNGGDNLGFGSAATKGSPGNNVLVDHVSSTASGDDGISPAYNAHDITIRWSLIAGCTRSVFISYGGTRVTLHHNIITRQWIRGPTASGDGCEIDVRNNYIWGWAEWGSRVHTGGKGNFVGNVWKLDPWAGGKPHGALTLCTDGTTNRGNLFEGCKAQGNFSEQDAVKAPPIRGEGPASALRPLLLDEKTGAGCMPRDKIDQEYLTIQQCAPKGDPVVGLLVPSAKRQGK